MTNIHDIRRTEIFKSLIMNPISADCMDVYSPGYLVIHDGCVKRLTHDDPRQEFPAAMFHDLDGFAILPGFIDVHVHLPQFAIMGIGGEPLLDWLADYTYPEESRFSDPEYARHISEQFFDALLANGTTCAAVYCSVHEPATEIAFEVAARKGIRAFIGKTMMDQNVPEQIREDTEASVASSSRLHGRWDGANEGRLRYIFSPRFAGSCSMRMMQSVAAIAHQRGAFIQSHLSENRMEVNWIRDLFPESVSYANVYADAGLLGDRTIMGHCIHLTDAEITVLAQTHTRVAFCPHSNRTLRSGTLRYDALQAAGVPIALGTDVAGGPSLSMFRQMGEALNSANAHSPCLTPAGAFFLATLAGARALHLEDRIGSLDPGKDADFAVIDYRRTDPLSGRGEYNTPAQILSRLCFKGDTDCVKDVYIRGTKHYGRP
jgi:guanine deaminase